MSEFFDPKIYTDDQLLEQQNTLNQRIVWASKFSSTEAFAQLQRMLQMIEFERRERAVKSMYKGMASIPPIETDPDLAAANNKEVEEKQEKIPAKSTHRPKPFSINRVVPTSRPTSPDTSKN